MKITLQEFAEIINSADEWRLEFNDIIEQNGWVDETGNEFGICSNGEQRLVFNEAAEAVLKNTWGGARQGAGRKPMKQGQKVTFSCRLKVETKEYIYQRAKETGLTATEVLETIIEIFKDEHKENK